ncbi:MAG: hypothetical protein KatS3mg024_2006 [Armatimonadota bacterium]|nr:MAG: hypothetical protein KatS3mg024_2006 [Armatimonadota bacterium]
MKTQQSGNLPTRRGIPRLPRQAFRNGARITLPVGDTYSARGWLGILMLAVLPDGVPSLSVPRDPGIPELRRQSVSPAAGEGKREERA